ncbi:hypothetical protein [Micromonospora sp. NPDC048063]|uniref:hypothetical protein n=1 Tax=Micromonospora sp. NPDC048063 TaxID=3364256 RepID=UPI00371D8963
MIGGLTTAQLALPLVPLADLSDGFKARHQVGHYRAPWDFAAGAKSGEPAPREGDLVPAWRCCHCGGIAMSRYFLVLSHGCEDVPGGCRTSCRYRPDAPSSPYRMDAHWIPPTSEAHR